MQSLSKFKTQSRLLTRLYSQLQPAVEADIRALLGNSDFTTNPTVLQTHGKDEGYHELALPHAVVFPRSTEQISELLKICSQSHTPIVPFGAGTSLEGHISAVKGGICLNLSKHMTNIISTDAVDKTCWVQAGTTREDVNAHLRDTGLFFSVDPGANATIGGMAATRASGTTAVKYGTMRDNVKALTVVLADGRIIKTGRPVRKSSAGYDLTALFVGSEGTLGIITEVALQLHPQPESAAAAVCSFPELSNAVETAVGVMQCGVPVARIELLDEIAIAAVNNYSKTDLVPAPTLFFEFHGSEAGVKEAAEAAEMIAGEHRGSGFQWAVTPEERKKLWAARHSAYYAGIAQRPGCRGFPTDLCVPLSKLTETVLKSREIAKNAGFHASLLSHVGDSNFHLNLVLDTSDPDEVERAQRAVDEMIHVAHAAGGTCTGEHGIGVGKLHHLREEWYGDGPLEVMKSIKAALDPRGILNPGKLGSQAMFE